MQEGHRGIGADDGAGRGADDIEPVLGRTVHRVFARFDATAAATIREHRLEACRQAMVAPRNIPRSLTDIAAQFGFIDLSVFSRAFTATYGISPSRYREQHR